LRDLEAAVTDQQRRLVRRSTAGRVAGVCAGIAEYLDTDVTLVRLAWVVLSIVPGGFIGGLIAYVAAWIVMPDLPGPVVTSNPSGRRLTRSVVDRKVGGVCGGLAAYMAVDSTAIRVAWVVLSIVPGCVVMGLIAYLVAWFIMPEPTGATTQVVPNVA
jgi:phage shock protein PspC (stress-responsive transcriptional regulator)